MGAPRELAELLPELPLPLAQLGRRALNAQAGLDRHNAAFYLAEATLKLAASARIGLWLDRAREPGSELARSLEALALPSLGHWCGFLRNVGEALVKAETTRDLPLARGARELTNRRDDLAPVAALAEEIVEAGIVSREAAKQSARRGVMGFFELLVAYRNEVIGHGGQRSTAFYERLGGLLVEATAASLGVPSLLGGLRLTVPLFEVEAGARKPKVVYKSLMGLGGLPLRQAPPGAAPVPGELYLFDSALRIRLHPLVVFHEDEHGREHFGFLNRTRTKTKKDGEGQVVRRAEYLDYVTGQSVPDTDACDALTELLGALRGHSVDAAAVDAVARTLSEVNASALQGAQGDRPDVSATAQGEDPARRVGEVIDGKYRLVGVLGAGGMGVVYRAQHVELPREYALKVMHASFAAQPESAERFRREARQAAAARHPGIVDVLDFGRTADGGLYLVMEPLDGHELREETARGPMAIDRVVRLAGSALEALAAAHATGVVHRDLKPANLFVVRDAGGGERVKVLDFGIAKAVAEGPGLTQSGTVLGTPVYMSPEQLQDAARVDARADVYSMGATMFHMLTGERPVDGASVLEVIAKVVEREVRTDPRALRPEVPEWLAAVVKRAMQRRPEDRFASAEAMRDALGGATEGAIDATERATELAVRGERSPEITEVAPRAERTIDDTELALPAEMVTPPVTSRRRWLAPVAVGGLLAAVAVAWGVGRAPPPIPGVASVSVVVPSAPASLTATAPPPEPPPPPGMVRLPGGTFEMGSRPADIEQALAWCKQTGTACDPAHLERETPPRTVTVSPFAVDVREVTNAELARWLNDQSDLSVEGRDVLQAGQRLARLGEEHAGLQRTGDRFEPVPGHADRAAVLVSWLGAERFCAARGRRLPTEAEWEHAARGVARRPFPWGDALPACEGVVFGRYDGLPCASSPRGPASSTHDTADRTPEGVLGLGGNVREWVGDAFAETYAACPAPCRDPGAREPPTADAPRVVRGGSWWEPAVMSRGARRSYGYATEVDQSIGFRCVLAP